MRTVSFFHRASGLFNGSQLSASDESAIEANTPPDHGSIDGHHDHLSKRVDIATGEVVDYQPPQPSADHVWNCDTKRWMLSAGAQATIDRRATALVLIARLEASQHRAVREAILDPIGGVARLKAINDEIATLRKDL